MYEKRNSIPERDRCPECKGDGEVFVSCCCRPIPEDCDACGGTGRVVRVAMRDPYFEVIESV